MHTSCLDRVLSLKDNPPVTCSVHQPRLTEHYRCAQQSLGKLSTLYLMTPILPVLQHTGLPLLLLRLVLRLLQLLLLLLLWWRFLCQRQLGTLSSASYGIDCLLLLLLLLRWRKFLCQRRLRLLSSSAGASNGCCLGLLFSASTGISCCCCCRIGTLLPLQWMLPLRRR